MNSCYVKLLRIKQEIKINNILSCVNIIYTRTFIEIKIKSLLYFIVIVIIIIIYYIINFRIFIQVFMRVWTRNKKQDDYFEYLILSASTIGMCKEIKKVLRE
jgi:cell division protein FtsL